MQCGTQFLEMRREQLVLDRIESDKTVFVHYFGHEQLIVAAQYKFVLASCSCVHVSNFFLSNQLRYVVNEFLADEAHSSACKYRSPKTWYLPTFLGDGLEQNYG